MRLCGMILIIAVTEKGKTMTDREKLIEQAEDILDKWEFFYGQRAGRELWEEKPEEVQNADIEAFCRDLAVVRSVVTDNNDGSKWIPVSERLPDHFGVFIVAIREPFKERVGKDCADFDPFAKSWLPSMCWDKGYKVTHWMELPEPPGEGSNVQA